MRTEWRKTNAHGREGLFVGSEHVGCVMPCFPDRWAPLVFGGPHLPHCSDVEAAKAAVMEAHAHAHAGEAR